MAERNNKARMDQIDRIRKKLEKEKADFADELQRMRRDAQQKVFANMDDIRDKMHSLRNSQKDNTQMEEKIRMVREELEKMKASITSVTERWRAVAARAASRRPAAEVMEALLRR
ncbi:unnamed protein product [Prorocentrum cordatum]|uniref:Coiled-coil domain-containing protein 153 n=1 Tax=Prorocentrum cordatum TaxID=2364126 RepID=A0ABN9RYE9_9DINO|nr:unnamed protein product [Polarella glacialis]